MKDLKPVNKAPTEEAGLLALDKLEDKWGKNIHILSTHGKIIGII